MGKKSKLHIHVALKSSKWALLKTKQSFKMAKKETQLSTSQKRGILHYLTSFRNDSYSFM